MPWQNHHGRKYLFSHVVDCYSILFPPVANITINPFPINLRKTVTRYFTVPASICQPESAVWFRYVFAIKEHDALERCMLQFASYDKQTVYDEEKGCHVCEIFYDIMEETELLIRILSFGPVVEVLGPERIQKQIRQRIARQMIHME
ncbi:MAG: WYL domain-containing protein [Clostridium sp.]|uniref:WYL domain-containing protein n=1 Tax=Clostridium sp. (strain MSTE9) TaxID=1105031 RepID=UPI0002F3ECB9|nr:WYL domain-containing protein [Clostridium sp.]